MADAVIEKIDPIRLKIEDYLKNPEYLIDVMKIGAEKSSRIAEETIVDVKRKVGVGIGELSQYSFAANNVEQLKTQSQ